MLAETGSVQAAAAFVGMARETAYRLRRKPGAEEFAQAWDLALVIAGVRPSAAAGPDEASSAPHSRKVTQAPTWRMMLDGLWQPVLRRGKYAGTVQKADDSVVLGYLARRERACRAERQALRLALGLFAEDGGFA